MINFNSNDDLRNGVISSETLVNFLTVAIASRVGAVLGAIAGAGLGGPTGAALGRRTGEWIGGVAGGFLARQVARWIVD